LEQKRFIQIQNKSTMKRIIFFLTVVTLSTAATAQKGNWYIGGVVGYSSNTEKSPNGFKTVNSSWAFAPEGGTFLQDDIQLGLALGISGTGEKNDNGKIASSSSISPTAYVRKFFKVTDNFSTFGGFYLNYTSGKSTDFTANPSIESTESGVGLRLGVGIAYALSPRFTALGQYGLLGYQSITSKTSGSTTTTDSSFNFGVNTVGSTLGVGNGSGVFNVGLYYTFKTL
jgi:hypothetical protein